MNTNKDKDENDHGPILGATTAVGPVCVILASCRGGTEPPRAPLSGPGPHCGLKHVQGVEPAARAAPGSLRTQRCPPGPPQVQQVSLGQPAPAPRTETASWASCKGVPRAAASRWLAPGAPSGKVSGQDVRQGSGAEADAQTTLVAGPRRPPRLYEDTRSRCPPGSWALGPETAASTRPLPGQGRGSGGAQPIGSREARPAHLRGRRLRTRPPPLSSQGAGPACGARRSALGADAAPTRPTSGTLTPATRSRARSSCAPPVSGRGPALVSGGCGPGAGGRGRGLPSSGPELARSEQPPASRRGASSPAPAGEQGKGAGHRGGLGAERGRGRPGRRPPPRGGCWALAVSTPGRDPWRTRPERRAPAAARRPFP